GHCVLQDRHAGRGGARVSPCGRAAPRRSERPLLYRPRRPQAGAVARGDGGAAPGRGEGRRPAGGVPQPRLRIRAARAARRGGSRLRRSRDAGADRRQGVSGLGCGGAQARRLRRRRRAARPRARAVREGTAAGLVLGPRAGRCRSGGIRAGTRPGRGRGRSLPLARGAAEQPRGPEGAVGRSHGRGGPGARRAQERALAPPAVQEPGGSGLPALPRKVTRARGLACDSYKDRCLRRRIAVRMRARGVHTFDDYAQLLDQDGHEYDLLLDALTINVTKFYRNAETWRALEPWLDGLWKARRGDVRTWSAGCASGEEPYTVAITLAEAARRLGQASLFPRARVDATDIDRTSLERTGAAEYAEPAFTEMPPELVRRYFTPESPRRPLPELRRIVRVLKHDLTSEPAPAPPYDPLVCRNVVIYFDRPMQERL